MIPLTHSPLTEDELQELEDFLLSEDMPENIMDIAGLDGFLTAIVCSPTVIMPSEWLRWV